MSARIDNWLSRGRGEDGFTLIEVLIAAFILTLAATATFGVLSASTRNAQRAQAIQVAQDKAQEEMEKLQAIPYDELALKRPPNPDLTNPLDPNYRVRTNNTFLVTRDSTTEPASSLILSGQIPRGSDKALEGVVMPGPIDFSEGNVSGKIYRYIVWRNDPSCPENAEDTTQDFCPGGQDYKQLIVAVKLNKPVPQAAETDYVEVQSLVANPEAQAQRTTQGDDPGVGGGGGSKEEEEEREREELEDETGNQTSGKAVTAQQFFLSDTPCSESGLTLRQPIAGDHLLHNTLGICANGPQTGEIQGAPDALLREAPPDPAPADETNPPLYDYSGDSYLTSTNPDTDKGVQIPNSDAAGCQYYPTGVHPESKVHRWVTDPMPRDFALSGTVTLEFYSRTLGDASYPATVCVYLFTRHPEEVNPGVLEEGDLPFHDAETGASYWTKSSEGTGSWPRNEWAKLRLTMKIAEAPTEIVEGDRLGVALSVDPGTTTEETGIPVMFDHPDYPTRLEVDTTTPFEGE